MNQMNKDSNSINITGLTDEEVRQRVEEGFTNRTDISTDKTTKEIVISNVFTYFNLIFLVIAHIADLKVIVYTNSNHSKK